MTNTLISRFLSGIILCFFTGNLFALNTYNISGFDEKIYTYHFDRADQESDLSSWMREAQFGMTLAVSEWERQSVDLYTDAEFRAEAGIALRQWTQEELEKRFSQWLFKRFFGDLSGEMIKKLDNAVEEANRLYTYHTDDDGNVLYDETGSPMVIRPYEYHNLEEERELWARHLVSAASNELQKYQAKISALFPELLAYIDKDKRNDFEKKLHEVLANSVINKRNEFEALLAREERLFIARRTGDIYSLRKESENTSAAMIVSQLIRETENSCNAGIASLEERIEAAKAGTGDLVLAGEEWLAAFQEQFERGLKAWSDAEERFILRRMEWERDSGEKYLEGEEAWRSAFVEFEKQQLAWENNARNLFSEGEQLFINISGQLNNAITEARNEFEKDAVLRINSGMENVRAWAEMYITYTSVMAEAKECIDYWLTCFSMVPPANALDKGTLGIWVKNILNNSQEITRLSQNQIFAGSELIRWNDIYLNYKIKANESMGILEKEFGFVLGMNIGSLDSVDFNNSESFFLDEYQIELLRAKAISGYWENRLSIAEAVYGYSKDVSAGRVTEAEGLSSWREAKENYEKAIQDYENSQKNVRSAGNNLEQVKYELEEIAKRLYDEEEKLNEIYRKYSIQVEAFSKGNTNIIQNNINSLYMELTELYDERLQEYFEFSDIASDLQKETFAYALNSLHDTFINFNILAENESMPDINYVSNMLLQYSEINNESIEEVLTSFLINFDLATEYIPVEFDNLLIYWKESLIDYLASDILYLGITVPANITDILNEYNTLLYEINNYFEKKMELPESMIKNITYYQYLLLFMDKYNEKQEILNSLLKNEIAHWRKYIVGSEEYEIIDSIYNVYLLADSSDLSKKTDLLLKKALNVCISNDLYSILDDITNGENELIQNILYNGQLYDIMAKTEMEIKSGISSISSEIDQAKASYNNIINIYKNKANEYSIIGNEYERLYSISKILYESLNNKRVDYEKQDAIQRWAGSAYLYNNAEMTENIQYYKEPLQEWEYCKEMFNNAQTALAVLENLYNNQETSRPFNDSEYMSAYLEYQESLEATLLAFKGKTEISYDIKARLLQIEKIYNSYITELYRIFPNLIQVSSYYDEYTIPEMNKSTLLDYLYIKDSGDLGISRNYNSRTIKQIDQEEANELYKYFNNALESNNEGILKTNFEKALLLWAERMKSYNLNSNSYLAFGLALDYLFDELSHNNPGVAFLQGRNNQTNMGSDGAIKIAGDYLDSMVFRFHDNDLKYIQANIWNNLTEQQRSDLEFLVVLLLTGGSDRLANGFDYVSNIMEMENIINKADSYKYRIRLGFTTITAYASPYLFDHSDLVQAKNAASIRMFNYRNAVLSNKTEISSIINNLVFDAKIYNENSKTLDLLQDNSRNIEIGWKDIETYLLSLRNFSIQEVSKLKYSWEIMIENNKNKDGDYCFYSIGNAINAIFDFNNEMTNNLEYKLVAVYNDKENQRKTNQDILRDIYDDYIKNTNITLDELTQTANDAYGNEAAAIKKHYYNIGSMLISNLKSMNTNHIEYVQLSEQLLEKLLHIMEQCYQSRYKAELTSREIEWNEQLKDLDNKYNSWIEAAGLILERGRNDWKTGIETMEAAYEKWRRDFLDQYNTIDEAWNIAYLESLKNKEQWINTAINTAGDAHNTMLMSLGQDAETGSRKLDTFIPASYLDFGGTEKASEIMNTVLSSAGIINLYSAVNAISGSAGTVLTQTKSGLSGLGTWNSNMAKASAKELALSSTTEIATEKMRLFALQARESLYAKKDNLQQQIKESNKRIDDTVDDIYLLQGGWLKSGNLYSKEIIVHSTLFTSAITESTVLESYKWYVMDYWDFKTQISDSSLENYDYLQIQDLMSLADAEIINKSNEVFGGGGQTGLFFEWIGEYNEYDQNVNGEIDRLIKQYVYWEGQQAQGIALMNSAFWDKPLWDSRDSWFSAPSIRSVVDVATSVVATVVGAVLTPFTAIGGLALAYGINMSDDLLFGALDVACGYKSWDEAGFEFGKKSLITAVTTVGGAAFTGVGTAASEGFHFAGLTSKVVGTTTGFAKTAITVGMGAAQAITVGTVTSAISAITYKGGEWGWSKDAFTQGMTATFQGATVGGVTSLTSGTLNLGLEGFYGQYYNNGEKLSALIGGMAGQGLNYAMGGDITLNALNLGFLDDSLSNTGILELHFGRDGFSSNLGMGGVDASLGTLVSAFKGLEAWKVNYDIWTSDSKNAKEYIIGMRSLYSGSKENKDLYQSILGNTTNIVKKENAKETETIKNADGTNTIYLGSDALNDGSRFGLSVVLSHESYRDGVKGTDEEQRLETDQAVMGHINTALGLMGTYGVGSIGATMAGEADTFLNNYNVLMSDKATAEQKEMAMNELYGILYSYDSSADYWRMQYNGTLVNDGSGWLRDEEGNYINSDGTRTKEITKNTIGDWNVKTGLLEIMFGGTNFTSDQISVVESIMTSAGLTKNGEGLKGIKLDMNSVMLNAGNTISDAVFRAYYNNTIDYEMAKKLGIDLIYNTKGNWEPNTVFTNSDERYNQLVAEKYGFSSDQVIQNLLENKYLQSITTDNGKKVNVLKISEDNPYISLVLGQRTPAFVDKNSSNYNYNLNQAGCNFMSTIAVPQLLTGNVLTADQVNDVWRWATNTRLNKYTNIMWSNGFVNDVNQIGNHVLHDMEGYSRYNLTVTKEKIEKPNNNANLVAVKEKYKPSHFALNNSNNNFVYNPWPYLKGPNLRYDGVYLNVH